MIRNDLTGEKYGVLCVESFHGFKNRKSLWKCKCSCGNTTIVQIDNLKNGHTKSCGCMKIKANRSQMKYHIENGVAKVYTSSGKCFLVDIEDIDRIISSSWSISSSGYVHATIKGKDVLLHRYLVGAQEGKQVDHISGDKLDNRKSNLRICSALENNKNTKISKLNTSGIKGVHYDKHAKKWRAVITCNGKYMHLGLFTSMEDAGKARQKAEKLYFGEYMRKTS